ncbi:MAG: diguanylate cyclase [Pseudomonadota bacterium]
MNDTAVLEAALETVSDGVLVTGPYPSLTIVYANAAFYALTGYSAAEVIGKTPALLVGKDTPSDWLTIFQAKKTTPTEVTNYRKSGTPLHVEWTVRAAPAKETSGYLVAALRDLTPLRELEHRQGQLELLASMQRKVGTAGLDLSVLRQKVVDVAMDATGAEAAAVEEVEGDTLVYTAVAGSARSVEGIRLPVDASLSGTCYKAQIPIFCEDGHHDSRVDQDKAEEAGFRSGVLVPLLHAGHCFGALKVYSGRPGAFQRDQLKLLEMASYVLAASLYDARQFKNEQDRRTLLVDALPILISFVDNQYRYGEINAAYSRWFDVHPDQILGRKVVDVLGETAFNNIRQYMDTALAGERVRFEMMVPYALGGPRPVEAEYIPVHDTNDQVLGFYALVRDLTERRTAERDHLTHVYNRRGFDRLLKSAIATASRYQRPLSLLFLDIDHFKPVNDQCGHTVGDKLLRQVANLLRQLARESDVVCRWGGEEFAVLVPETALDEAVDLAERLRATIARDVASPLGPITVSIGVAQHLSQEPEDLLIQRADQALYWAKEKGRNRVETAD